MNSGDGSLEIMIPGHKLNVIFCVVKLKHYIVISDLLQTDNIQFLNHIMIILHACAEKWEGWANKSEGQRYVLTWKLPTIDDADNEKNEQLLEDRTEKADQSLIAAVKIVSEMRRASHIT